MLRWCLPAIRQSNGCLIGMIAFQDDGVPEIGYWLANPFGAKTS
jgi:RimJ/RimL family protein N-acetyltransferase